MLLCNVMTLIFRPGESSTLCVPLQFEKLYAHPPNTLYCTPRFIIGYSGKAIFFFDTIMDTHCSIPWFILHLSLKVLPWYLAIIVTVRLGSFNSVILVDEYSFVLLSSRLAAMFNQNGQNCILNIPNCGGCPIIYVKTNARSQLSFLLTKWECLKSWGWALVMLHIYPCNSWTWLLLLVMFFFLKRCVTSITWNISHRNQNVWDWFLNRLNLCYDF